MGRAKLAYSLGLIPSGLLAELGIVAQIRNHFAHHLFEAKFTDKEVQKLCETLTIGREYGNGPFPQVPTPRVPFVLTIMAASRSILSIASETRHQDRIDGPWVEFRDSGESAQ
jgi:hypothetical protein